MFYNAKQSRGMYFEIEFRNKNFPREMDLTSTTVHSSSSSATIMPNSHSNDDDTVELRRRCESAISHRSVVSLTSLRIPERRRAGNGYIDWQKLFRALAAIGAAHRRLHLTGKVLVFYRH